MSDHCHDVVTYSLTADLDVGVDVGVGALKKNCDTKNSVTAWSQLFWPSFGKAVISKCLNFSVC